MRTRSATPTGGTWCSGITSASHAEGPGFKSQCVQLCFAVRCLMSAHASDVCPWPPSSGRRLGLSLRYALVGQSLPEAPGEAHGSPHAAHYDSGVLLERWGLPWLAPPSPNGHRPAPSADALTVRLARNYDSLAERSKAVAQGAIPKGRGFEPHSCQFIAPILQSWLAAMLFLPKS